MDWIKSSLVEGGMISPEDIDLFHLADAPEQALEIVQNFYD